VSECLVCQQNKGETIKTPGILQPLTIPSQHWEQVSMDLITGLLKSEGKTFIMVVVDRLTKYAHFSLFPIVGLWVVIDVNKLWLSLMSKDVMGVFGEFSKVVPLWCIFKHGPHKKTL
jgi:hypothetical protein